MKRLVYVSGPYTAKTPELTDLNIARAKAVGLAVRAAGYVPVVPHIAIVPCPTLSWQTAMDECLELLGVCDAILLMEGWEHSEGARIEHLQAREWKMPIFRSIQELREGLEAVA